MLGDWWTTAPTIHAFCTKKLVLVEKVLHRLSLQNIKSMYRIPEALMILVKTMYNRFKLCSPGRRTTVQSGVKHGCVMSGFLFLVSYKSLGHEQDYRKQENWHTIDLMLLSRYFEKEIRPAG